MLELLDPDATGLLPILLGKATKAQDRLCSIPKRYTFSIIFGIETDTLDASGKILRRDGDFVLPAKSEIQKKLEDFPTSYKQLPPVYSAKKMNGKRLCDLTRQGVAISQSELESRAKVVTLHELKLVSVDSETGITIDVLCSAGTYVRVLALDIAKKFATVAYADNICREACAGYSLSDAVDFEDLKNTAEPLDLISRSLKTLPI